MNKGVLQVMPCGTVIGNNGYERVTMKVLNRYLKDK